MSEQDQDKWAQMLNEVTEDVPRSCDHYRILKTIGAGQFGEIKLAVVKSDNILPPNSTSHEKPRRYVAIKRVKKANMKPVEILQQRVEIEVLKHTKHPNIIECFDFYEDEQFYEIVMEFMRDGDLYDFLASHKFRIHEEFVKSIIYQICEGLKYLHSLGIVHRDIKLENILVTRRTKNSADITAKIVDFGLSKMIGPDEKANEPFGTLGYVAPEVIKNMNYSNKCDVWSLGCIMYALICGQLPFDGETQEEITKATLRKSLEFRRPVWNTVSDTCKNLITNMLKKSPDSRYSLDQVMQHEFFNRPQRKLSPK